MSLKFTIPFLSTNETKQDINTLFSLEAMIPLTTILTEAVLVGETLFRRTTHFRGTRDAETPLVFVHGISPRFTGQRIFRRAHQLNGNSQLLFFNYDPRKSIEQIAEEFGRFLKRHGGRDYRPVGHSLGATVIRFYIECGGGKDSIQRAALIAAANHGTLTVYLWHGASAQQLRPESDFLTTLNRHRPSIHYLNLWSPHDECIIPRRSALLEGAQNVCIQGSMHYSILGDQQTHRSLGDFFY